MKKVNYELMRGGGSFTNKNDNLSKHDWREYYLVSTPMGASYGL